MALTSGMSPQNTRFATILMDKGVKKTTVADLHVSDIKTAEDLLNCNGGAMGDAIRNNKTADVHTQSVKILTDHTTPPVDANDVRGLATASMMMVKVYDMEGDEYLHKLGSVSGHPCMDFPSNVKTANEKEEYTISYMLGNSPKPLKATDRPGGTTRLGSGYDAIGRAMRPSRRTALVRACGAERSRYQECAFCLTTPGAGGRGEDE